jgi:NADPH:quinone reductase-like Zn-dependent oxidoreductase
MEAFAIQKYGKNSPLERIKVPKPAVRDNDVRVEVHAASVNRLDTLLKNGEFKLLLPQKMPLILGNAVAGVVTAVGAGVESFKVGDEVYAKPDINRIGTFAEYIAIDEKDVALKPKHLRMEEAATVPLVGLTSWQALVEIAQVKKGQKVLIQAGSGGVGTFAIQLAKHIGATVATPTSEKSFALVKSLGADIVIDYKKDDFETMLHEYDVVLNRQDGKTLEKSLRVLKPGGKLISISGPPDPDFAKDRGGSWFLKLVMTALSYGVRKKAKRHHVSYSFLFMRASGAQLRAITSLIDSGIIRPVVDRGFPFESTKEALAYVETGRAKGKVIVKVI